MVRMTWIGCLLLGITGCATGPQLDNPLAVRGGPAYENPVVLPPGPANAENYNVVFERVLSVVNDYFDIRYSNPFQGEIVTVPKIAPGFEQPWRPGSPDTHERLLATLQTYRFRCITQLQPAEGGGYTVQVIIYKELRETSRPQSATLGISVFSDAPTVDRQYDVLDGALPPIEGQRWIPKGRDHAFEQELLRRIQKSQ